MSEITFRLNSPLTDEDWNLITDAEFEHSDSVTFTTPSGKEVEFRKVVRGEWVLNDDQVYECKDCGYIPSFDGYTYFNYCPNCGARMDERRRE